MQASETDLFFFTIKVETIKIDGHNIVLLNYQAHVSVHVLRKYCDLQRAHM